MQQRAQIAAFADDVGIKVRRFYGETLDRETLSLDDRPTLRVASEHATRLGAALIVANLAVLGPGVQIIEQVAGRGVPLLVTGSEFGSAGLQIRPDATLGVRTWRGSERTKGKRRRNTTAPLGNRTNLPEARAKGIAALRVAADNFAEQVYPLIREIISTGETRHQKIAEILNARHVKTARGSVWYATTVRAVLMRVSGTSQIPHGADEKCDS